MMNIFKLCKRTTCLSICMVIFLSVIIVTSQAMTISREDLSQLFNGFLDKLEQQEDDSVNVKEKMRQVETRVDNEMEEDPAQLSQKLTSILRELHHAESDIEDTRIPPPAAIERAETADAMLIELLNESRRMAHANDETNDDSDDDSDDSRDRVLDVGRLETETVSPSDHHDGDGDEGLSTRTLMSRNNTATATTSNSSVSELLPNENENGVHLYDYAACELRLNERLEPLTLARYHGFRGTVKLRQHRSNGSSEVLIRLYGLTPSNSNQQGHGVFIREFGDLRDGCERLGPIFNTDSDADQSNDGSLGLLGVVSPDESGFVEYRSTEVHHFDLAGQDSVFGRSIVIEESPNTYSAPLGCCVIGVASDGGEWM